MKQNKTKLGDKTPPKPKSLSELWDNFTWSGMKTEVPERDWRKEERKIYLKN